MNRVYERRWLRFAKGDKMRYIGHLDLQMVFQSAIRRAKLPIAYSMGFNPHQRMSFALPLPVGMDSICEYMEILLNEDANIMELDKHLPDGLRILEVYNIPEKTIKPAAAVCAADYRLTGISENEANSAFNQIIKGDQIVVLKKTKSGEKHVDIKPDILNFAYDPVGAVTMRLSAGSAKNLSPQVIVNEFFSKENVGIVRTELYASNNRPLHEIAL